MTERPKTTNEPRNNYEVDGGTSDVSIGGAPSAVLAYLNAVKEHRAAQCAEIELLQSQAAIIKPTVGPIKAANQVLTSLCKELESRSDSIAKEIKIAVDEEQRLRRELSEECQIEIVKLSEQVQEADLKRRKGIEEHASVHMELKQLLVEYQEEYKKQATELDSFHEQISMLKQKYNGIVKEEDDLNISSLGYNKILVELEKNRMKLRSQLNAGSALYNIDKATTIHVKLKTKQLDRSTLMRKVIKLKEEHNFLQKAIASNTAASARMRKEQTEMEGDEALALSKKEVITLNARNLVSARQSFIERTSLLKGLLPTGDHDNS
eukprot:228586_1